MKHNAWRVRAERQDRTSTRNSARLLVALTWLGKYRGREVAGGIYRLPRGGAIPVGVVADVVYDVDDDAEVWGTLLMPPAHLPRVGQANTAMLIQALL